MNQELSQVHLSMLERLERRPREWIENEGRALEVLLASQVFDEVYPPFDRAFQAYPFRPSELFPYSHFAVDRLPDGTEKTFQAYTVPMNAYASDERLASALAAFAERVPSASPASFRHLARHRNWLALLVPLGTRPRLVLPGVSIAGPYGTVYPVVDAIRLDDEGDGWSERWGLALRTVSLAQIRATGAKMLFCVPV